MSRKSPVSRSPEYLIWWGIISRCCYKSGSAYKWYGARGVKVCGRWRKSFKAFLEDVGRRPSPSHSIGRIDNEGHYEPGNVRWETRTEQSFNRRNTRKITVNGVTLTLQEWAKRLGVPHRTIYNRMYRGMTELEAVTVPVKLLSDAGRGGRKSKP